MSPPRTPPETSQGAAGPLGLSRPAGRLLLLLSALLLLFIVTVASIASAWSAASEAASAERERDRVVRIAEQVLAAEPHRPRPGDSAGVAGAGGAGGADYPAAAGVRTRFELLAERQNLPPEALSSVDVDGDGVRLVLDGLTSTQLAAWLEAAPLATADTPDRPGQPPLRVASLRIDPVAGGRDTFNGGPEIGSGPTRWSVDLTLE